MATAVLVLTKALTWAFDHRVRAWKEVSYGFKRAQLRVAVGWTHPCIRKCQSWSQLDSSRRRRSRAETPVTTARSSSARPGSCQRRRPQNSKAKKLTPPVAMRTADTRPIHLGTGSLSEKKLTSPAAVASRNPAAMAIWSPIGDGRGGPCLPGRGGTADSRFVMWPSCPAPWPANADGESGCCSPRPRRPAH